MLLSYSDFQKADAIAADLTLTTDRLSVLDFSRPFLSSPLTILTKVNKKYRICKNLHKYIEHLFLLPVIYLVKVKVLLRKT